MCLRQVPCSPPRRPTALPASWNLEELKRHDWLERQASALAEDMKSQICAPKLLKSQGSMIISNYLRINYWLIFHYMISLYTSSMCLVVANADPASPAKGREVCSPSSGRSHGGSGTALRISPPAAVWCPLHGSKVKSNQVLTNHKGAKVQQKVVRLHAIQPKMLWKCACHLGVRDR